MKRHTLIFAAILAVVFSGCAANMAKVGSGAATVGSGYVSAIHKDLLTLPKPDQKIAVAVYKFRDQTGQYKPNPTAASFSTAVTQGATSVLIKALEDSGWFIPIEREGLQNLLMERKIVRQTRDGFLSEEQKKTMDVLPPLLYGAVLLEGGIISYDTDLVTGGFGLKYFGAGGAAQVRTDQLALYLRAVSVKNGMILKSVYTSKTVLSQQLDLGLFRFVRYQKLLEAEGGLSTNEPTHMCVVEAVEKAVYDMIVEGVLGGLWKLKNPEDMNSPAIQKYLRERDEVEVKFDRDGAVTTSAPSQSKRTEQKTKQSDSQKGTSSMGSGTVIILKNQEG
jgi:curli production assembly/transport component CsgG